MICHPMRPASRVLGEASMKTRLLAGAMALVLFGCSQQRAEDAGSSEAPALAEAVADSAGGPAFAVTAAPGVALNYHHRTEERPVRKDQVSTCDSRVAPLT